MILSQTLEHIKKKSHHIEIFGLGYVGFPLAVRLANQGLKVIGIDINAKRIERLRNNLLMDSELRLKDKFLSCRKNGNLVLAESPSKSEEPKIGIICVPTPIPNQDTQSDIFVKAAVENFLSYAKNGDLIILESSIEVGTTERIKDVIEAKGFKIGHDFGLCFCPERIDPDNKEWHIENIPRVIYCSDDTSFEIAKEIYKYVNNANLIRVDSPKIAEVVKSFENAFRLVNISLVNELAILCDKLGINVKSVIDAASTKPFGFLAHYPSAGAGGHCIPKDPRFLLESAKKFSSNFSTIENALKINAYMPIYIANSIEKSFEKMRLPKSVLVCGLSYKANVDDMRDSPGFKIIKELKNKGFKVSGYDPFFKMDHVEKYLIENNLKKLDFEVVKDLDEKTLEKISCMCIVQHHEITKKRIDEIYEKSLVPFIYDCQNKIRKNPASKTILDCLGD
jgi:UDP-N-acetyl-D-glucosamine dehydrogenase